MADPYLSEIRMFAGNYAPRNWALCDGTLISIAQKQELFALLGNMYGGDGRTTFALPDLRGRLPLHRGAPVGGVNSYIQGRILGQESVNINIQHLPKHTHSLSCTSDSATDAAPAADKMFATTNADGKQFAYSSTQANPVTLNQAAITKTGGTQSHDNMMPSIAVNFIICMTGAFPARN